jgi:streptogramin lyase
MFTAFPYNIAGGLPDQIEVLNNTSVWITAPGADRVAELRVNMAQYVNIPVADFNLPTFPPGGLALDSSGPWITAPTMQRIGRYDSGTLAFWNWYQLPLVADNLTYTESSDTKELWFTSMAAGKVGLITLNNQGELVSFGTHPLPAPNSQPVAIVVADNGTVWITESNGNQIAAWQPPFFNQLFLSLVKAE